MIKHIVMWRLKDSAAGTDKAHNTARAKEMIEALNDSIDVIVKLEVGKDFNGSPAAYDIGLYSEFASRADLRSYQDHPEHQKVVSFMGEIVAERAVVDYEV